MFLTTFTRQFGLVFGIGENKLRSELGSFNQNRGLNLYLSGIGQFGLMGQLS